MDGLFNFHQKMTTDCSKCKKRKHKAKFSKARYYMSRKSNTRLRRAPPGSQFGPPLKSYTITMNPAGATGVVYENSRAHVADADIRKTS